MNKIKANQHKGLILKIAIVWLSIFLLIGFLIATSTAAGPVNFSVIPEVPKTGEPVVATFIINNPSDEPVTTDYQLFVNGELVESGSTRIAAQDSSRYQYAHRNNLERGEQVNFVLKTNSEIGSFEKIVSLPAYPSQLMSSFVSFAAFSTSLMDSMISMEYFTNTFGTTSGLNTGIILTLILIGLLIFLELTQTITANRGSAIIGSYRSHFTILSTFLFIIFMGMVFTKVVLILAA